MAAVSIIIAAHNAETFIEATLASALGQDHADLEVLVVDDGSTDATGAMVRSTRDPRLRLLCQENRGVSEARNAGMLAASGEFLLFLDADDLLVPGAVKRFVSAFRTHPKAILVYGEAPAFISVDGPPSDRAMPPRAGLFSGRPQGDALKAVLRANPFTTVGAVMVRRELALRSEGFPVGIDIGEDWVFWCDIAARGDILWLGRDPVVYYRLHPGSVMRRNACTAFALWPAIDAVFQRDAILARLSSSERVGSRRAMESHALACCAQELLKRGRWRDARRVYRGSLRRRPFVIRTWILWLCAVIGYVPDWVRRRLK